MSGRTAKELRRLKAELAGAQASTGGVGVPSGGVSPFSGRPNATPWVDDQQAQTTEVRNWADRIVHDILTKEFLSSREFVALAALAVTAVIFVQDNSSGRLESVHGLFFAVVKCAMLAVLSFAVGLIYRLLALFDKSKDLPRTQNPVLFGLLAVIVTVFIVLVIYSGISWQLESDTLKRDLNLLESPPKTQAKPLK